VLNKTQFMLLTALGVISLVLVLANVVLFSGNRDAQGEVNMRNQYIQQSLQLEPLYQGIVRNLAEIAAKTGDAQINQLLTSQGITFNVNSQPPQQQQQPAEAPKGKGK
jgi:hypothetical protein